MTALTIRLKQVSYRQSAENTGLPKPEQRYNLTLILNVPTVFFRDRVFNDEVLSQSRITKNDVWAKIQRSALKYDKIVNLE